MHRLLVAVVLLVTIKGFGADQCANRTREETDVGDTLTHQKPSKLHATHVFVGK